VVAGGIATFLNPEPIAPFIDLFLLGEAETLLPDFLVVWEEAHHDSPARVEQLSHIARNVPGAYVPSLFLEDYDAEGLLTTFEPCVDIPRKIMVKPADIQEEQPATSQITSPHTEFSYTTLVEIGRGCGRGCRFCAAGFVYRPVRHQPSQRVVAAAQARLPSGGKVGLLSAAVSDHPDIDAICLQLRQTGASLSVSSLRADSITPSMLEALHASGLRTVAIAPEAGSERLRRVINKNLTEDEIINAVSAVVSAGIANVRLYFMVGLPTETEEDVQAIIELTKRVKHQQLAIGRGQQRLGTLTLSINSFVPKPSTPFQWAPFCDLSLLKRRLKKLKRALSGLANVRVHADVPRWAYIQALLARGDRRLAPLLVAVVKNGGNWAKAIKSVNVNPEFYVHRERQRQELFPWDFIDHGVSKDYLWHEYQLALDGQTTEPCEPDVCTRCGVC
jgi:radical SAM superfamily enzyme YgiQ (UPF0313 family)